MKIVEYDKFENFYEEFYKTIEYENLVEIDEILSRVKKGGDTYITEVSNKFGDGSFLSSSDFIVADDEEKAAFKKVKPEFINQIKTAHKNIKEFAKKQLECLKPLNLRYQGSFLGHKLIPLNSVLCYVPGGNYPLPSSCIMTVTPAKIAGVKQVVLTSPKIKPETIVAAKIAGADKIYKLGGAQAIAAFAYGTETISPVDKIVGPGNKYVTYAKKQVYGTCGIDFLAGPSEVLIIADETANPLFVAGDMLAQCEHDRDARAYLITTSSKLAYDVKKIAYEILGSLKTRDIAKFSFMNSFCVIVNNANQAIEIANKRAPEHLELVVKNETEYLKNLTNYGSLFIGGNCAEVFGDYVSGTNHVLPTNSAAKYTSGLSVFDFVKTCTYQKIDFAYSKKLAKTASKLAEYEGLYAHKLAGDFRLNSKKPKLVNRILSKQQKTQILAKLCTFYFQIKRLFYYCKNINYPKQQSIFALWHAHQCGLYALEDRNKTTVMVSNSNDGEIIAQAGHAMGLNIVRGSHNRKGAAATLELIEAIKSGNNGALTIDGPRGPKHKVKKGVIDVARITGVPIVPMAWFSPSFGFLKFKTWDEFCFPLCFIKMKALYGNPIYIPKDADSAELENLRKKVETELIELNSRLIKEYKKL